MNLQIEQSWNGTPLTRRSTDGYVNATALCKANGKRWYSYACTRDAKEYLEALVRATGLPASQLVIAKAGVGTWVHPQVALDLARWVNPRFGTWMDQYFLEEGLRVSQVRDTSAERKDQAMAVLAGSRRLIERLGRFTEEDEAFFQVLEGRAGMP